MTRGTGRKLHRRYHPRVPILRPLRALRFDATRVPHLAAVLCPPYDIISPSEQAVLLARHPNNAVRLELPPVTDPADPGRRYRDAARTLAEWRRDGTLRMDEQAALYVHEMRYEMPDGSSGTARGVFARLRLEPLGRDSSVRRHEHTMSGPKEDRYHLLRATGTNLSPIVLVHDRKGVAPLLDALRPGPAMVNTTDASGVRHRLWAHSVEGSETATDDPATELIELLAASPLTIADGHHRYETALRYRDELGEERARDRPGETDPPYDYVLALVYAVDEAPAVLATHRVIVGIPSGGGLLADLAASFDIEPVRDAHELQRCMGEPRPADGASRFGVWTRDGGAILRAHDDHLAQRGDDPEVARRLDVNVLASALRNVAGVEASDLVGGERVLYTKDAGEAMALVERGDGDACFLLDATPVEQVIEVAAAGGVMPQKSTYFHPKAPTGLLFNPLEP